MFRHPFIKRIPWALAGVVIGIVCLAAMRLRGAPSTQPVIANAAPKEVIRQRRQEMLRAAEECMGEFEKMERAGMKLTPDLMNLKAIWIRRVYKAKLVRAETAKERIAATEWYVDNAQRMIDVMQRRLPVDMTMLDVMEATYFLKEAELRLAELKSAVAGR